MKYIITIYLMFLLVAISSCKKKKPQDITNNYYSTIQPLIDEKISLPITKGSYWIYNVDVVNVSDLNRTFIERDSLVAEKDSVIKGIKYILVKKYVIFGTASFQSILAQEGLFRDSAGFNIDPNGKFLNHNDFESITVNNIPGGTIEFQLKHSNGINTPNGFFSSVINYLGKFEPLNLSYSGVRYLNNYFSDGVGLIQSTTFYVNDPVHFYENNLIRYKIK